MQSLRAMKRKYGFDHPALLPSLEALARVNENKRQLAQASAFQERTLAILQKHPAGYQAEAPSVLQGLIENYKRLGWYASAESRYPSLLALIERQFGSESPQFALKLVGLAGVYAELGRYAEANALYQRGIFLLEKELADAKGDAAIGADMSLAFVQIQLANSYRKQGQFAQAEQLYLVAIRAYEKAGESAEIWVPGALDALGRLYRDQGQGEKSEQTFLQSLALRKKQVPYGTFTADAYNELAALRLSQGRFDEAKNFCFEALGLWNEDERSLLTSERAHFAFIYIAPFVKSLAAAYTGQGEYSRAAALLARSLQIAEKAVGFKSGLAAELMDSLAVVNARQKNFVKAEPLFRQALETRRHALGKEHRLTADTAVGLAFLYDEHGNEEQARAHYKQALAVYEKVLGVGHPDTQAISTALAALDRKTKLAPSSTTPMPGISRPAAIGR